MWRADYDIMQGEGAGNPDAMPGRELWDTLQSSRQNIEVSFLLLLAKASKEQIPCSEVAQYNKLRNTQLDLERRALAELDRAGINVGIREPSTIPEVEACQTGEESIWLAPDYARSTLEGAVQRYRAIQRQRYDLSRQMLPADEGLGLAPLIPVVIVAGVVLVAWAAVLVTKHVFVDPGKTIVNGHKSMTDQYLELRKAGLSHSDAMAVFKAIAGALPGTGPKLPFGLSPWQGVFVAFVGGALVVSGTYLWLTRTKMGQRTMRRLRGAPAATAQRR